MIVCKGERERERGRDEGVGEFGGEKKMKVVATRGGGVERRKHKRKNGSGWLKGIP